MSTRSLLLRNTCPNLLRTRFKWPLTSSINHQTHRLSQTNRNFRNFTSTTFRMSSQQPDIQTQTHIAHDSKGQHIQVTSYQPDWTRSDEYHNSFILKQDESLTQALANQKSNGLPDIAVSEAQGKLLHLIARSIGAKRALELGTLGGYSTIWLAKALPDDGQVISLEVSEEYASVARQNIENAGQSSKVKVIVGEGVKTLPTLPSSSPSDLFDLAFIDADKPNNVNYFREAERLVKSGGVIIVDNVVRHGRVADPTINDGDDDNVDGVRKLLKHIKESDSVEATTIATVGNKGFDGFLYALKH